MLTQPHKYDHHTPSSSAIHDAYMQMVLKHYGSFVHLGEKPLYQKSTLGKKKWSFGLFLLYSEVENDPQACPLIYLISLATFYFNTLLSYPCERIIKYYDNNNMNKMANFSFV